MYSFPLNDIFKIFCGTVTFLTPLMIRTVTSASVPSATLAVQGNV